jgi:hypothetical protein
VQKTNDDLLAEIEMARIGAIASGDNGGVEALQKQYAQANAINASVNNAYQKEGLGTQYKETAEGQFGTNVQGRKDQLEVGYGSSASYNSSTTMNTGGKDDPDAGYRYLKNPAGQNVKTPVKDGMWQYNGKIDGTVAIYDPEIIKLPDATPETFATWFENKFVSKTDENGNRKYEVRKGKNPKEFDLYISGKKVGIAQRMRSTAKVGADGRIRYTESESGSRTHPDIWGYRFDKPISQQDQAELSFQSGVDKAGLTND